MPINYVNHPGVVLQAACFGDGSYEEIAAAKCISNLLVSGFRRLEADVFWDASRSVWSLCPVELGGAALTTSTSVATATSLEKRQEGGVLSESSAASTTVIASSVKSTATLAVDPATTSMVGSSQSSDSDVSGGTLIKAGSYSCTKSTDWTLLVNILSAHMVSHFSLERATTGLVRSSLDRMLTRHTGEYRHRYRRENGHSHAQLARRCLCL